MRSVPRMETHFSKVVTCVETSSSSIEKGKGASEILLLSGMVSEITIVNNAHIYQKIQLFQQCDCLPRIRCFKRKRRGMSEVLARF